MTQQTSLFTLSDIPRKKDDYELGKQIDFPDDAPAIVYMVTFVGGHAGDLYVVRRDEAQRICSSPTTRGMGRGGEWMLCFTCYRDWTKCVDDFIYDDGRNDALFEELGIKPIYVKRR